MHRLANNKYAKTPKGKYFRTKYRSKEIGREFKLNIEEFIHLLSLNCHYCGIEKANGVDRKDSNNGYTKDNVLPCCWACNCMKKNYNYEFFINHINKIINHMSTLNIQFTN